MIKSLTVASALVCLTSCVTTLKYGAQNISFIKTNSTSSCSALGEVSGSSSWGSGVESNLNNAKKEVLNNAYYLRANAVKITFNNTDVWGSKLEGIAYRCGSVAEEQIDNNPASINYDAINRQRSALSAAAVKYNQSQYEHAQSQAQSQQQQQQQQQLRHVSVQVESKQFCLVDNYGNEGMCYNSYDMCKQSRGSFYAGCILKSN